MINPLSSKVAGTKATLKNQKGVTNYTIQSQTPKRTNKDFRKTVKAPAKLHNYT